METLDLGALATDMAELFEPLAEERGQRIERAIEPVTVVGHPQILKQAVGNLIENAIKYSPAGTALKVLVRSHGESGAPEIVVQDRGPGIPVNAREQAVRPFVRLENPSRQPGSGMGLAIAAAVARLHRGKLILENAEPGLRVRLLFGQLEPA
jgi:signal transduction histidine kinase